MKEIRVFEEAVHTMPRSIAAIAANYHAQNNAVGGRKTLHINAVIYPINRSNITFGEYRTASPPSGHFVDR
jgi:hypothetical protein